MTEAAFDKIKAGLDDARRYLDGSADRLKFRTNALSDAKISTPSTEVPAQPPKDRP